MFLLHYSTIRRTYTIRRAYATMLRPSVCGVMHCVAKRCVPIYRAVTADSLQEAVYEKSIGTKMNDLDLCLEVVQGHVNHCGVNISWHTIEHIFKTT